MDSLKLKYNADADFLWVDIEDHAAVLENVDVESFPTLLLSYSDRICFWGAVPPYSTNAMKLIDRVQLGSVLSITDNEIKKLDKRLREKFDCHTL
jgi:hypothetical protein